MTLPIVLPEGAADELRRRRLRRMRALALALLLFAAVVYALTRDGTGLWGYVNAGAEASMVGAIADWFAVTALFRHPLGLPIPHTALIPRRKDDLGRSLQDFVTENFLREEIVRDRLHDTGVAGRLGDWLGEEVHARRVVAELASVARVGLDRFDEEDLEALLAEVMLPRLLTEPIAPIAGNLLAEVLRDGAHQGVVDLALEEMEHWLVHNQATFAEVVGERAPWWAPERLNEVVTDRLHLEVVRWIGDIRADPRHRARRAFDDLLGHLAADLLDDTATQERAERLKERLLEHPQFLATATALIESVRHALRDALADVDGPLRRRLTGEVVRLGGQLRADPELAARVDGAVSDAAVFVVNRYGDELTAVITHTVERWDGREAARRIELHVGRDLQFIRINGTIVGGLVGVLIHAAGSIR